MDHTRTVQTDLDSAHRELSNGGLGIVVAPTVFFWINFHVFLLGVRSICRALKRPYCTFKNALQATLWSS